MSDVVVVIGPGQIGQAIARRGGVGKHLLRADKSTARANAAAETLARAVAYAISQPEDVDINEILFRPTRQEL